MALAQVYSQAPQKQVYDVIIIAHFDSHGVATAAALKRRLQGRVLVVSKFPETGPTPQFPQFVEQLRQRVEAREAHIIDIPVNVRSPDLHIDAEAKIPASIIYHVDHHETSIPFANRLAARGVIPMIFSNAVQMAAGLGLLSGDEEMTRLAKIGIVADRDRSILAIEVRGHVEGSYLMWANRLDVIVRQPQLVGCQDQGCVAEKLAEYGVGLITSTSIDYPPERLAGEWSARIVEEGSIAVLIDYPEMPFQESQWVPKTLEQVLLRRGKHVAVAVLPGYNPRTRQTEGYDVRILKYWLSDLDVELSAVAKDVVERAATQGNVVGHADYVSIRFSSLSDARNVARMLYQRSEGIEPSTAHLINDQYVAHAVRRDFQAILERIEQLLENQQKMYQEYLELKKRQVELLERTQRHEYD